jgi:hypothetical protein
VAGRKDLLKRYEKLQKELLLLSGFSKKKIREVMKKEKVVICESQTIGL